MHLNGSVFDYGALHRWISVWLLWKINCGKVHKHHPSVNTESRMYSISQQSWVPSVIKQTCLEFLTICSPIWKLKLLCELCSALCVCESVWFEISLNCHSHPSLSSLVCALTVSLHGFLQWARVIHSYYLVSKEASEVKSNLWNLILWTNKHGETKIIFNKFHV